MTLTARTSCPEIGYEAHGDPRGFPVVLLHGFPDDVRPWAQSFDSPDFVEVVIHSYRHRHGNAPGEARFDPLERRLAERPPITVPTTVLHGEDDAVDPAPQSERHMTLFPAGTARRVVPGGGHFLPREQPAAVAEAILALLARTG